MICAASRSERALHGVHSPRSQRCEMRCLLQQLADRHGIAGRSERRQLLAVFCFKLKISPGWGKNMKRKRHLNSLVIFEIYFC